MADEVGVTVRESHADDFQALLDLYVHVATEGRWIGGEVPVDAERQRQFFDRVTGSAEAVMLTAEADGHLVGNLSVELSRGIAEVGLLVGAPWRGRGIGSTLMAAGIDWARAHSAHKMTLTVWPHNQTAIALYVKFGFSYEGRLRRHYRRRNGELWDAIQMGLVLDEESSGSPYAG
jgi:putative acetyltransferase